MAYENQFDGSDAFSGGGFMPSQTTQIAAPQSSHAKNRDTQSLLPLTAKQITEALNSNVSSSNTIVDGVELNNVRLVGMVYNILDRVTDRRFVLYDGTGQIECTKWLNENQDSMEMDAIKDGMYVRVHGQWKVLEGKGRFSVFSIRPVTDYNEIAGHFIECIYVHLYNTKLRNLQGGVGAQSQMTSGVPTPVRGHQAGQSNQIYDMVLTFLRQPAIVNRDMHVEEIAQQLNIPVDKIREAMDVLVSEGAAYSTLDEHRYKAAYNG